MVLQLAMQSRMCLFYMCTYLNTLGKWMYFKIKMLLLLYEHVLVCSSVVVLTSDSMHAMPWRKSSEYEYKLLLSSRILVWDTCPIFETRDSKAKGTKVAPNPFTIHSVLCSLYQFQIHLKSWMTVIDHESRPFYYLKYLKSWNTNELTK